MQRRFHRVLGEYPSAIVMLNELCGKLIVKHNDCFYSPSGFPSAVVKCDESIFKKL